MKNSTDRPETPSRIVSKFEEIERYENREQERKRVTIDTPVVLSAKKEPFFEGWYADREFSKAIDTADTYQDMTTFYPKWSARWYEVCYVLEEGINSEKNHHRYAENSGLLPLYPAFSQGRQFLGWQRDGKFVECIDPHWRSNVRLHAVFQDPVRAVFEDGNGQMIATAACDENGFVDPGLCPCKAGYRFAGWSFDRDGLRSWDPTRSITENQTFYANWKPEEYLIALDFNGGMLDGDKEIVYTIESPAFILPSPSRPGYRFTGWRDERGVLHLIIRKGSSGSMRLQAGWIRAYEEQAVIASSQSEIPDETDRRQKTEDFLHRLEETIRQNREMMERFSDSIKRSENMQAAPQRPARQKKLSRRKPYANFLYRMCISSEQSLADLAKINRHSGLHADHAGKQD